MKNNFKIIVLFLWVIFSFPSISYSQKVISYKGDTLVALTSKQLSIINGLIADGEITKKALKLSKTQIKLDSVLINHKDSIILLQKYLRRDQEDYITKQNNSISRLNNELTKRKKKEKLRNSIFITVIATTLSLLIIK